MARRQVIHAGDLIPVYVLHRPQPLLGFAGGGRFFHLVVKIMSAPREGDIWAQITVLLLDPLTGRLTVRTFALDAPVIELTLPLPRGS